MDNILLTNELQLPLLFLYAETHYRFFSRFPSLLFKKEPEVLFDLPHRLEPGNDLPVVLTINDVKMFPDVPDHVAIALSQRGNNTRIFRVDDVMEYELPHALQNNQRFFLYSIPYDTLPEGEFFVTATVTMRNAKKTYTVINDNLNTSSKRAFRCFNSPYSLPGKGLCSYGDLHVHSQYSQSHVEFGPSIGVIDVMSKSCGLSFVGVTDHSYDLSCEKNDFLKENQSLDRWTLLKKDLSDNSGLSTIFLTGEEISCLNCKGKTVHLGTLGIDDFIQGSSDGARRNLIFKQSLTIAEAIDEIHRQGGIAFAAHPGSRSGFLQRIFLNRGVWEEHDCALPIDGMQALNSGFSQSWQRGKSLWLKMIAANRRVPLCAGNDAHGDFNRYRAIKTPFLSIYENFDRCMGYAKTGIYDSCSTGENVLRCISNGATFISTGPYIAITYTENPDDFAIGHPSDKIKHDSVYVHAISTPEFGALCTISVFAGTNKSTERTLLQITLKNATYDITRKIDLTTIDSLTYVRAEIRSRLESGKEFQAYTSPCWLHRR